MRLLLIGGTGLISSEVAALAAQRGDELTLLNRGTGGIAPAPPGARVLHADATDADAVRSALRGPRLRGERFDAVVQFVAFTPDHVRADVATFAPLTDQYVLIATAAGYRTHDRLHALTEDTPLENRYWEYARKKVACEAALRADAAKAGLPWTIVRPAHTYGPSKIPAFTGNSRHPWTIVDRLRRGADIVVPGDGTSLWTSTHARDVASGLFRLVGNPDALGEAVHTTSDEALTWLGLYAEIASAAGVSADSFARQCVFVPSEALMAAAPAQEGSIRGDKMHPAVYDTSKIHRLARGWDARISFADGIRECIDWFEADSSRQTVDDDANAMFDRLSGIYRGALTDAGHHASGG